eukprot:TRINITY_DN3514_c0_g1_i1.p1 TRINITY_DN3514_c0_g1~~TRINITY_DN3514_c0_g1_i1.p1  ORF type:complete len:102 (-),score=20.86 TRINITY_DN3514_c0_g1_i1:171-431(-)
MNSAKLGVAFSAKTEGSPDWKKEREGRESRESRESREGRESRDRLRSSGSDNATELRRVNSVNENKAKVIERITASSNSGGGGGAE